MKPKKALIITLIVLGLTAYIAGSFWVVGMMKKGNITVPFFSKQKNEATTTSSSQPGFSNGSKTVSNPTPNATPTPIPSPTPTPTPLQGPGRYACDRDGICGDFSDQMRKYCSRTFADRNCLGMCGTPSIHCSQ